MIPLPLKFNQIFATFYKEPHIKIIFDTVEVLLNLYRIRNDLTMIKRYAETINSFLNIPYFDYIIIIAALYYANTSQEKFKALMSILNSSFCQYCLLKTNTNATLAKTPQSTFLSFFTKSNSTKPSEKIEEDSFQIVEEGDFTIISEKPKEYT